MTNTLPATSNGSDDSSPDDSAPSSRTTSDALYLLKTGGLAVSARPGEGAVVAPAGREIAKRMVRDTGTP